MFINEAGTPLRRTLFRAGIWRPSLVRAGLLGKVALEGDKFGAPGRLPAGQESDCQDEGAGGACCAAPR